MKRILGWMLSFNPLNPLMPLMAFGMIVYLFGGTITFS